jgi:hypothetical protein
MGIVTGFLRRSYSWLGFNVANRLKLQPEMDSGNRIFYPYAIGKLQALCWILLSFLQVAEIRVIFTIVVDVCFCNYFLVLSYDISRHLPYSSGDRGSERGMSGLFFLSRHLMISVDFHQVWCQVNGIYCRAKTFK